MPCPRRDRRRRPRRVMCLMDESRQANAARRLFRCIGARRGLRPSGRLLQHSRHPRGVPPQPYPPYPAPRGRRPQRRLGRGRRRPRHDRRDDRGAPRARAPGRAAAATAPRPRAPRRGLHLPRDRQDHRRAHVHERQQAPAQGPRPDSPRRAARSGGQNAPPILFMSEMPCLDADSRTCPESVA